MEKNEEILLPVKFDYMLLDNYLKSNGIQRNVFATDIGISESAVSQILGGTKMPSRDTAVRIARCTGLSLDLLFGIENNIDIIVRASTKEYLSNDIKNYIIKQLKEYKGEKYGRILKSLYKTNVVGKYGKEPFISVFAESILNVLIRAKLNDTTFIDLFAESANKLSVEINKFKTIAIGNKTPDFTFQQILNNSNEIKGLYENTKETLHKAIDTILLDTLGKEFDAVKPKTSLF